MYPVEFATMFNGDQTQMHASQDTTGIVEELTGTEITGEIDTGTNSGDAAF